MCSVFKCRLKINKAETGPRSATRGLYYKTLHMNNIWILYQASLLVQASESDRQYQKTMKFVLFLYIMNPKCFILHTPDW
jgi:hypothetical protein